MKSNLTVLVIFNTIIGCLSLMSGTLTFTTFYAANVIVFWWLRSKEESQLLQNKNIVLVMTILSFLTFNIVSGAIGASVYSQMNRLQQFYSLNGSDFSKLGSTIKPKPKVDPQIKKVDTLLKLGVGMVFVAGFVFATTGWNQLNSIVKIVLFLLVAALFVGLSKFCEKKIKIKSTVYLYWMLGMAFIMFSIFTMGYNRLFGEFFSFYGSGELLYFSFCSLILSILGLISYYNFTNKRFLYVGYLGMFLACTLIMNHFNLSKELILLILTCIATITQLFNINHEKDLYTLVNFSNLVLVVLGISFMILSFDYNNVIFVGILYCLFIFNLYKYYFNNNKSDFNYFIPILSYVLIIPFLSLIIDFKIITWAIITSAFATIINLICSIVDRGKLNKASLLTANILNILSFIISLFGPNWLPIVICLFSVIVYVICCVTKNNNYMMEYGIQPLKISTILLSLLLLFKSFLNISDLLSYWLLLTLLSFMFMYCIIKHVKISKIYEKYTIGALILCLLSISQSTRLIISIITFISVIVFFDEVNSNENSNYAVKNLVFGLLLYNIFSGIQTNIFSFVEYFSLNINIALISNLLIIIIFMILGVLYKDDKVKLNMSLFAIIVPIIALGNAVNYEGISIILPSLFTYYITFNICRLVKNNTIKDVVGYIGYSISFLLVIFSNNYFALGYSCILFLLSLLIGYWSKKYNALFRVSVVALIILIVYQLKEFWAQIPAWLYLLLLGIFLIVFATHKQLKMINKNEQHNENSE